MSTKLSFRHKHICQTILKKKKQETTRNGSKNRINRTQRIIPNHKCLYVNTKLSPEHIPVVCSCGSIPHPPQHSASLIPFSRFGCVHEIGATHREWCALRHRRS